MITDAHQQGRLAFAKNHPMSACDYPQGSDLRAQWMDGWTEARNAAPQAGSAPRPGLMRDARRAGRIDHPTAHES
ncbi:hypothetical protein LQ948_15815 [Jiella sp. MQZ9-1]|uniref:Ribosome modulation factor n=1 Tax=Jiella flava TaxID=2816857 RepID=A0A939JY68_9HYPH|nr:Rmf/CrpP family protein [Jiella flava]MBO0664101.1 hypothetical protein [Jiella flava]MCD2472672.1 hypothetical protein [Jiella flava]